MQITEKYCIILPYRIPETKKEVGGMVVRWFFAIILWAASLAGSGLAGALFAEIKEFNGESTLRAVLRRAAPVCIMVSSIAFAYIGMALVSR